MPNTKTAPTAKPKRTLKDKLMFIVLGKYPDSKPEKTEEQEKEKPTEKSSENIFAETPKSTPKESGQMSAEQKLIQDEKFLQATKMTLHRAKEKIAQWKKNGEDTKVQQGKELISQYFPNEDININTNTDIQHEGIEVLSKPKKNAAKKDPTKKSAFSSLSQNKSIKKVLENPMTSFTVSQDFLTENNLPQPEEINDDERVFAGLSYFPFLSFFVIFTRKDSDFSLYHAWQGFAILAVFLGSLPFYFLLGFIWGMGFLFWIFYMVLFGSAAFAAFMAWSGQYVSIPFISNFAQTLSGR